MNAVVNHHKLVARPVSFDFSSSPVHWIPDDPICTHLINGINLILPAGEFFFCRVYNKALPHVADPVLRDDVKGFIRQEATHARAHIGAQEFLSQHGYNLDKPLARANWLFSVLLGEAPLGIKLLQRRALAQPWLVIRVGVVAAVEHFTGALGQWCMDNTSWDKADPVIADLFRWHLAEEVEHRAVAFDLLKHLVPNRPTFYLLRQSLMLVIFPMFIYVLGDTGRKLGQQDPDTAVQAIANRGFIRLMVAYQRQAKATDNGPTLGFLCKAALRWVSPRFHPESEGNTVQALAYLARSPAVQGYQSGA